MKTHCSAGSASGPCLWSCLSSSQAQQGMWAQSTCLRSPSKGVLSSFPLFSVLWHETPFWQWSVSLLSFQSWKEMRAANTFPASCYLLYSPVQTPEQPPFPTGWTNPEQETPLSWGAHCKQSRQTHGGKEEWSLCPLLQGNIFGRGKQFSNPRLLCLSLWKSLNFSFSLLGWAGEAPHRQLPTTLMG